MSFQLWIEEPDKPVWHHARVGGPSAFLVTCGWLVPNRDGRLWPQILATALGYGVFLAALGLAFGLRALLFRRRR